MNDLEARMQRIRLLVCDVDGVLTDGKLFFDGEGRPFRAIYARDAAAFTLWRLAGRRMALVTGLGSAAVDEIASRWRFDDCLTWVRDKERVCRELAEKYGLDMESLAFLGDDLIDRNAMRAAGLAVAVADAAPEAKAVAHWVTEAQGGAGPAREVITRVLSVQGLLEEAVEAYCSRKDEPDETAAPSLQ